jgi:hypothetical protein
VTSPIVSKSFFFLKEAHRFNRRCAFSPQSRHNDMAQNRSNFNFSDKVAIVTGGSTGIPRHRQRRVERKVSSEFEGCFLGATKVH